MDVRDIEVWVFFFFQAEDGIRYLTVTGVQTCALPILTLTAKQRQYLRGLAHSLAPVVRVGKGRLTESIVAETKRSLEAHELIKVRIEIADEIGRASCRERV